MDLTGVTTACDCLTVSGPLHWHLVAFGCSCLVFRGAWDATPLCQIYIQRCSWDLRRPNIGLRLAEKDRVTDQDVARSPPDGGQGFCSLLAAYLVRCCVGSTGASLSMAGLHATAHESRLSQGRSGSRAAVRWRMLRLQRPGSGSAAAPACRQG